MSVRKEGDTREVVVDLDDWADLAERKIKEAQAAGHFDNLPGLGKPLQLDDNPHEGEWALAHRISAERQHQSAVDCAPAAGPAAQRRPPRSGWRRSDGSCTTGADGC